MAKEKKTAKDEGEPVEKTDANEGQTMGARAEDLTVDDFKGGKVKMNFPRRVRILVDGHAAIQFEAGNQDVPVSLKDHWYLRAHGVKEV